MYSIIQNSIVVLSFLGVIFNFAEGSLLQDKKKAGMVQELEIIKHHFEVGYAPLEWKKEHAGWDLNVAFEQAKQQILTPSEITTKEFHQIVRNFVQSTEDYHVSIRFCSTEKATLPFTARGIDGRYYIDWFDSLLLPESYFGIRVGDELIEFDGKPIAQVMDELMLVSGKHCNPRTEQSLAEISLTNRYGMKGDIVPKGTVLVKTCSSISGKENTCQVLWNYTPEHVKNPMDFVVDFIDLSTMFSRDKRTEQDVTIPSKLMMNPIHQEEAFTLGGNQRGLGSKKSFVPKLGKVVWEIEPEQDLFDLLSGGDHARITCDIDKDNTYSSNLSKRKGFRKGSGPKSNYWNAYIYKNEKGHLIGYVRIPDYMIRLKDLEKFSDLMDWMDDRTDALVIDQLNNPGGSSYCLYRLASSLTFFPLITPKHQLKISQVDALEAYEMLEWIEEVEKEILELAEKAKDEEDSNDLSDNSALFELISFQELLHLKTFYEHILAEWNAGRSLTQPIHLIFNDMINPKPLGKYTKPVVMLINELDFSCADFMPAILQDSKRALLFGTRTAGAGGAVTRYYIPSQHGIIGGSLTHSIAERANKDKIENLGVIPDIVYEITSEDISSGYMGYVRALNRSIQEVIEK